MSTSNINGSSSNVARSIDNAAITLLNHVDASTYDVTIKVRIIKLWKLPSFKIKNGTHSMELILMDEEGTRIQATVMNTYLIKLGKSLVERDCVLIKKFKVGDNLSSYRLTNHRHRLFLEFETVVMKCNDVVGSPHGFSFTSFDLLRNNALPADSVVDIIGYVHTYFDMYDHKTKNGQLKKKMNLQLRDLESRSIFVSLWESYAEKMDKFMSKKPEGVIVVVILQIGKFSSSDGRAYVSSAFHGTTLYINDDLEEITSFKNGLLEKQSDDSVSSRRLVSSQCVTNAEDEFLNPKLFSSIERVNQITEEKSVIVMGTLISFLPGFEWYYNASSCCNKKVMSVTTIIDKEDGSYDQKKIIQCPNKNCNKEVVTTVPRFKLPLRLQDNTGIVSLTLLDREARKMLKTSSKELLDRILDDDSLNMVPNEIAALVGKQFAFKIDITNFNITNNYKSFTISKFTDDPTIISKLEANLEQFQVAPSDSLNMNSMNFASQEETVSQDTVSLANANETPMSVTASNGKSVSGDEKMGSNTTHSELKRNLSEVYDVDDSPNQSSTKNHRKSFEGVTAAGNPTLRIPKKEK